jgi:hypothetical protein
VDGTTAPNGETGGRGVVVVHDDIGALGRVDLVGQGGLA